MPARVRLGELLVEAAIITREQLDKVLSIQRNDGRRLGVLLVEGGLVTLSDEPMAPTSASVCGTRTAPTTTAEAKAK